VCVCVCECVCACVYLCVCVYVQANASNPALVQSVSVGTTEYEYVEAMGDAFVERINQEFMKVSFVGLFCRS